MRLPIAALAAAMLAVPLCGASAAAENFKQLRDWFVVCDNLRLCAGFGFGIEADNVHLRVVRGPEADAVPEVTIALSRDDITDTKLRLAFSDPSLAGMPDEVPARRLGDTDTVVAVLPFNPTLLASLRKAESITVEEIGKPSGSAVRISLSGLVASLLFMDEQQKRVGTVTALQARGAKPARAVPAPPKMPVVRVAKPYAGNEAIPKDPPKRLVDAVEKQRAPDTGDSDFAGPIVARLSASLVLWGLAVEVPAYNHRYAFYLVENGKVREAVFDDPRGERDRPNGVTSPEFDPQTNILTATYRGRSMGDCGSVTQWGWDGRKFREISTIMMVECRGVPSDRWSTSFRARQE